MSTNTPSPLSLEEIEAKAQELRDRGFNKAADSIMVGHGRATKALRDLSSEVHRATTAPDTPCEWGKKTQVRFRTTGGSMSAKPRDARQVTVSGLFTNSMLPRSCEDDHEVRSTHVVEGDWLVKVNKTLIKVYSDTDVAVVSPKQVLDPNA